MPRSRLRRLIWVIAVAGLTCEVAIAFTTLLPGAPYVPQWPQFALFPFIFLVFGYAVLRARAAITVDLRSQPKWVLLGFSALVALTVLNFVTAFINLRGQPMRQGGRYFLNDHGHMIPVSRSGYEDALVYQQRIFTLGPSVFFALAAIALSAARETATSDIESP